MHGLPELVRYTAIHVLQSTAIVSLLQAQLQAQCGSGTVSEQNYQDTIEKLLAEVWKERLVRKHQRLGRHCAISCGL